MGVQVSAEQDDARRATLMRMEQPNGNEYWLGFDDFYVITRYNHIGFMPWRCISLSRAVRKREELCIAYVDEI